MSINVRGAEHTTFGGFDPSCLVCAARKPFTLPLSTSTTTPALSNICLLCVLARAFGSYPNVDWLDRRLANRHAGEPAARLQQFLRVTSALRPRKLLRRRSWPATSNSNQEVLQLAAAFNGRIQPPGPMSAAGPGIAAVVLVADGHLLASERSFALQTELSSRELEYGDLLSDLLQYF